MHEQRTRGWWIALALALSILALSAAVLAQQSYTLQRWAIGSGGTYRLTGSGGTYRLSGTLGQPVAGTVYGPDDKGLHSGFWYGGAIEYQVYLPLVLRAYR